MVVRQDAVRDDGRMLRVARAVGMPRATLWAIRTELEAAWVSLRNHFHPSARLALRRVRGRNELLLNVASGPFVLDGFVNLELRAYHADVVRWDCRTSVPVADGACRGIRIEHFLEHLDPRDEVPFLLRDCHRALAPGGVLRIVVPDVARFMAAYLARDKSGFDALAVADPFPDDLPTALDIVNHAFHQWHEHRWGYDVENLTWLLERAGFSEIVRSAYGASRLPALGRDRDEHAAYSLYVECVKPASTV
jgi:predicted SAM-dependent methyltransferase